MVGEAWRASDADIARPVAKLNNFNIRCTVIPCWLLGLALATFGCWGLPRLVHVLKSLPDVVAPEPIQGLEGGDLLHILCSLSSMNVGA